MVIRIVTAIFGLIAIACSTAYSQDAQRILRSSAQVYAKLKTYHFEGASRMTVEVHGVKYRMNLPVEIAQGETPDERLTVSNGKPGFEKAIGNAAKDYPPFNFGMPNSEFYNFATLSNGVKSTEFRREEIVESNGRKRRCFVVNVVRALNKSTSRAETVWIDKTSRLVLRVQFQTKVVAADSQRAHELDWVTTFTAYKLNAEPPQWLIERKSIRKAEVEALRKEKIGTIAPDFVLQGLDRTELSLNNLRDKIVLLDFWATWCLPCREELPVIAKIEREWGPKGLHVLRITDEEPDIVKEFLKTSRMDFATLVNGRDVWSKYGVNTIPTIVIIDKTGKIIAYDVAELSEAELVERLKQAGLDKP
jgi:cytochrome c biogenesis protein CcmG, thiol:disulfide interchange protein DsbE